MRDIIKRMSAVIILSAIAMLGGCAAAQDTSVSGSVYAMDTVMTITINAPSDGEALLRGAESTIRRLDDMWSATKENSEISTLNTLGNAEVSTETAELISFALDTGADTNGALDITLYPLLRAWGFTTGEYTVPDKALVEALLSARGAPEINGTNVTLPVGTQLDLGAVAKGYAGDILCEELRAAGVTSALLDLGGNIHAIGGRADGSAWRLGLKHPRGEGNIAVIELNDRAAVTSGDYERFFTDESGRRYCHILDPKTGFPADSSLCSVTVIGERGALCDALSTALFVMGAQQAEEYWRKNGGFDMILITADCDMLVTEGIAQDVRPVDGFTGGLIILDR